jgi:hypothetical protein
LQLISGTWSYGQFREAEAPLWSLDICRGQARSVGAREMQDEK